MVSRAIRGNQGRLGTSSEGSRRHSLEGKLLALACLVTSVCQLPLFVDAGATRLAPMVVWVAVFTFCLVRQYRLGLGGMGLPLFVGGIFFLFLCGVFLAGMNYWETPFVYCVYLSLFILVIGNALGSFLSERDVILIAVAFSVGAIAMCFSVYATYLVGADLSDRVYQYDSKNSAALIILTAAVFILHFGSGARLAIVRVLLALVLVFSLVVVVELRSRATIFGAGIVIVVAILFKVPNRRVRVVASLLVVASVLLLLNEQVYDTVVNGILLRGSSTGSLEDVSSGRASEWESFLLDMRGGELIGFGDEKRESLLLAAPLRYGMPIGLLLIALAYYPVVWGLLRIDRRSSLYGPFVSIALAYGANGLFEQLAPFGPGAKCFMLWLLLGILMANDELRGALLVSDRAQNGGAM